MSSHRLSTFLMLFESKLFLQRTLRSRDKDPNWESQCAAPFLSFYFLFWQKTISSCSKDRIFGPDMCQLYCLSAFLIFYKHILFLQEIRGPRNKHLLLLRQRVTRARQTQQTSPGQIPEICSECRWQLIDRIQDSLRELGCPDPGQSFGRGVLSSPEALDVKT